MSAATVAKLPDLCPGFPELPSPLVERPHYLLIIESMLASSQIVTIDGEDSSGKTILAAQFVLRNVERSFSLFISRVSSFSRAPEYLASILADQIHWHLNGIRLPNGINPEVYLRQAWLSLQRQSTKAKPFYIVVDGLLQLADVDPQLIARC